MLRSSAGIVTGAFDAVASTSALKLPAAAIATQSSRRLVVEGDRRTYRRWLTNSSTQRHSSPQHTLSVDKYQHFDPKPALDPAGRIPITPYDQAPLACSAPIYPKGHLVVHPYTQARPESTWPASIESVCPLFVEINKRTGGELEGWGVSFSEGDPRATRSKEQRLPPWDPMTPKVARLEAGHEAETEEFLIYAYEGNGTWAVVGPYSYRSLPPASSGQLAASIATALRSAPIPSARFPKTAEEAHIYVCTHGSRDCRCGVAGGELKEQLGREIRTHELRVIDGTAQGGAVNTNWSKKVKVFGISHVGGHKFAANALVYPHGDWYGNLRPSDTPLLLRSALAPSTSRHDLKDQRERLVHWPRWRGRLGINEEKTRSVWDEWGGGTVQTAVIVPVRRRRAPALTPVEPVPPSAVDEAALGTAQAYEGPPKSIEAATAVQGDTAVAIPFRKHDGTVVMADAKLGENLKDVAKRAGIEEIEATCQGKCECATCHAYLAPQRTSSSEVQPSGNVDSAAAYEGPSDLDASPSDEAIAAAGDEENDMLDYAISRKATSRLTCQVVVTPELVGWIKGPLKGRIQLGRY
ncbi:unnamed protein product [Parajaminaea phylloscopi]